MNASDSGTIYAISPAHARAARGLLDWSRERLAQESGVPMRTLARFESEEGVPRQATATAIRATLERAGIEFTNGNAPGVRLRDRRWFLELYKGGTLPHDPTEHFADFDSLFRRASEIKAKMNPEDILRVHLPASATDENHVALAAIGATIV